MICSELTLRQWGMGWGRLKWAAESSMQGQVGTEVAPGGLGQSQET